MDEEIKRMTQEEVIMELISLLKQNQMQDKANDVFELVLYIDGLQNKLDRVVGELSSVKEQLTSMEQKSLKYTLLEMFRETENRYTNMKTQLFEIKGAVKDKVFEIVEAVKQKEKLL